jgi:hypothetical protein
MKRRLTALLHCVLGGAFFKECSKANLPGYRVTGACVACPRVCRNVHTSTLRPSASANAPVSIPGLGQGHRRQAFPLKDSARANLNKQTYARVVDWAYTGADDVAEIRSQAASRLHSDLPIRIQLTSG